MFIYTEPKPKLDETIETNEIDRNL